MAARRSVTGGSAPPRSGPSGATPISQPAAPGGASPAATSPPMATIACPRAAAGQHRESLVCREPLRDPPRSSIMPRSASRTVRRSGESCIFAIADEALRLGQARRIGQFAGRACVPPHPRHRSDGDVERAVGPGRERLRGGEHGEEIPAHGDWRSSGRAAERHQLARFAVVAQAILERGDPREC